MTTGPSLCPIHLYERSRCSGECWDARVAFRGLSHQLRMHWYRRGLGQRPMAKTVYYVRYGRQPCA